jgi:hypothetical protein
MKGVVQDAQKKEVREAAMGSAMGCSSFVTGKTGNL